jgi:hypothetical protein
MSIPTIRAYTSRSKRRADLPSMVKIAMSFAYWFAFTRSRVSPQEAARPQRGGLFVTAVQGGSEREGSRDHRVADKPLDCLLP